MYNISDEIKEMLTTEINLDKNIENREYKITEKDIDEWLWKSK